METAIKKAVEGGWKIHPMYEAAGLTKDGNIPVHALLDPLFWQALGKAEGWELWVCDNCHTKYEGPSLCPKCRRGSAKKKGYQYYWHDFIEHLIAGKSPDTFFQALLANESKE